MLVPALCVSSADFLVCSCSLEMSSLPTGDRSALTASSLLEASSGFQWPLPSLCFVRRSSLCFCCSLPLPSGGEVIGQSTILGLLVVLQ